MGVTQNLSDLAPAGMAPRLPVAQSKATSIKDLVALYRALETLMAVSSSLSCQPRLVNDKSILTDAGREFDEINEAICNKLLDVMERLRDTPARNEHERTDRGVALLCFDLECDADVSDVALAAVEKHLPHKF